MPVIDCISDNLVFSILLRKDDGTFSHLATGFFIGLNGLFFTCGHTFRKNHYKHNPNNFYIGFAENDSSTIYPIKKLLYKPEIDGDFKGPELFDYAVGIAEIENENYLIFNRKRPSINKVLTIWGLNNITANNIHHTVGSGVNLSMISRCYENFTVFDNKSIFLRSLDRRLSNQDCYYNNIILARISHMVRPGNSGAPVLDENNMVIGIFLGKTRNTGYGIILLSKHCTKMVQFKSTFKFNPYQYLELLKE